MKNPIFAASYERGVELMAAGLHLDYLDALPRRSFRGEPLSGYFDSRVHELGRCDTGWVMGIRLCSTHPSGTLIVHWSFEPPWQNHEVLWGEPPEVIIPEEHRNVYKKLVESRVMEVLNGDQLIHRGRPVKGIICGRSVQPIGESCNGTLSARLSITDDSEHTESFCINFNVYRRSYPIASRSLGGEAGQRPSRHRLKPQLVALSQNLVDLPDFAGLSRDEDSDGSATEFPMV
jgi:hypothetical protein